MTTETDIFYPTVHGYKAFKRKIQKHKIKLLNNETCFENSRFTMSDRPLEGEPVKHVEYDRDVRRDQKEAEILEAKEKENEEDEEDEDDEVGAEEEERQLKRLDLE